MDKVPFRDVVSSFNLQTLKDIAYSLDIPIQGNKLDIIDSIIDRINSPEEVIDILNSRFAQIGRQFLRIDLSKSKNARFFGQTAVRCLALGPAPAVWRLTCKNTRNGTIRA